MRRVLFAGLTALAVSIGCVAFVGSASAGGVDEGSCVANTAGTTTGTFTCTPTSLVNGLPIPSGVTAPVCTVTAAAAGATCTEDIPALEHSGGLLGLGGLLGGLLGANQGHLGSHYVYLNGGPTLDVCGYPTYGTFLGAHNPYRQRIAAILGQNPASRYSGLYGTCHRPTIPTLVNGNQLNLSTWIPGAAPVNVCAYPSWAAFLSYVTATYGSGPAATVTAAFGANPVGEYNGLLAQANCTAGLYGGALPPVVLPSPTTPPAITNNNNNNITVPSGLRQGTSSGSVPSYGSTLPNAPSGAIETGDAGLAPDTVLAG